MNQIATKYTDQIREPTASSKFFTKNSTGKTEGLDNKTVRGITTTTADQLNSSNGYEHISHLKKSMQPKVGFSNGMKAYHPNSSRNDISNYNGLESVGTSARNFYKNRSNNSESDKLNISEWTQFPSQEKFYENLKYNDDSFTNEYEQHVAIILVIFSLSIFIGIFYISSDNIEVKYTNLDVPIKIK